MKLPPFEEFMKTIVPVVQDEQDDTNATDGQKIANAITKETSRICFNYIECYHNWLSEQLGD